ncbi:unnamed protein product [Lampetra planeri]
MGRHATISQDKAAEGAYGLPGHGGGTRHTRLGRPPTPRAVSRDGPRLSCEVGTCRRESPRRGEGPSHGEEEVEGEEEDVEGEEEDEEEDVEAEEEDVEDEEEDVESEEVDVEDEEED